uniref:Reverse transcriptase domain-containing protein n=1 Tax=Cannabis sativa TaxID=3483 RepID=A0A803PL06_CANSA
MSVLFFKHYWDSIGGDFCEAVLDFFHIGRRHKGVNATNIVLFPKVQNPKRPNHFRPISLCNVVYKVISKIIANRIKPLLPKLICPTQAAFVPGRNIQDNNVIAQEIVHSFNRKKGREGLFAIKIDLMKAYDRMSWGFIDHVLSCFGVPQEFRNWVSQCITTTSLNICLNGGPVEKISPSCGLRQGDPLSPYLFIWAAEILSRILENAQNEGIIKGIRLSRGGPSISHIFFADDLILVGRANMEEAKGVWGCLDQFCSWSGQKVNTIKTSIFFSKNTSTVIKQRIRELLGLRSPEGNVNYLGLPLFRSRQKDADFNFILDNLTTKLHVRDFWWGSEKGNHGLHLKAWDKLCLLKSLGGLGFRKSKEMNQAFLAKWGWNLLTGHQSLCCRILEAKYLKGKSFLDCESKASNSWFWKNVTKTRAIIRKGACKRVADGTGTNIWVDPWIEHLQGFTPQPIGRDMNTEMKVAELILDNGGWNYQKLNRLFDQETISAILKGGIPAGLGNDSSFWTLESNGCFSCKSAYLAQVVDTASPGEAAPSLWNKLWNSKVPERLKVLWWRILSKALPVRSELRRRFPIQDESFPLCGLEVETMEHLFLACNVASHLWRSSPWGIFPISDSGIRLWDWVKFLWDLNKKGINEHEVFLYASLIVDMIWRTRNDKEHLWQGDLGGYFEAGIF